MRDFTSELVRWTTGAGGDVRIPRAESLVGIWATLTCSSSSSSTMVGSREGALREESRSLRLRG